MEGRSVTVLSTISDVVADREKSKGPHPNALECHICLKPLTDPVATSCGHVFCWPCVFSLVENKRKRKPCPVCGTFLTRDMNIFSLYCGAGSIEAQRASGNVNPPRPSNPRMFMPRFGRVKGSNKDGSNLDTPISMSLLGQVEQEIEQEINSKRAQNERMAANLKRDSGDGMINDSTRVELARMEWKLMQEKSQLALDIVRLEGQLARAAQLLPNGWSDLTIVL